VPLPVARLLDRVARPVLRAAFDHPLACHRQSRVAPASCARCRAHSRAAHSGSCARCPRAGRCGWWR
jgi:hypothetical protein